MKKRERYKDRKKKEKERERLKEGRRMGSKRE